MHARARKGGSFTLKGVPCQESVHKKNQITPEFPEKHKFDLDRIKNYIQRYYEQLELEEKIYTTSKLIELISRTITKKKIIGRKTEKRNVMY